jgi:hypothetical protein
MQKAVLVQRRKEALKLHSSISVDNYLTSSTAGIAAVRHIVPHAQCTARVVYINCMLQ